MLEGCLCVPYPGEIRALGVTSASSNCFRLILPAIPFNRGPALPPRSSYEWHFKHCAVWLRKKMRFPRVVSPPIKQLA